MGFCIRAKLCVVLACCFVAADFRIFRGSASRTWKELEIRRLSNVLRRGLTYVKSREEAKTADMALGAFLVKGNLRWILDNLKENLEMRKYLSPEMKQMSHMCDDVFYDFLKNSHGNAIISSVLSHQFDISLAEDLKYEDMNGYDENFQLPEFRNCSFDNYLMNGTPNDSDSCILELIEKSCNISRDCWFQETNQLDHSGYKTTHRMLYSLLALKLGCGEIGPYKTDHLRRMKKSLCEQMLKEANALKEKFIFLARDLFMEQIALCGFEGYVEFAKKSWRFEVASWQDPCGCFGLLRAEKAIQRACYEMPDDSSTSIERIKRTDVTLRDSCHTHVTAVALSAIAFHLRVAIYEFF